MEIGALSSTLASSYLPGASAANGAAERVRQATRDASVASRGQSGAQNTTVEPPRNNDVAATRKAISENQETQKSPIAAAGADPRVQFKDSEGTRVMEVYDSKNVLIYQVPPKGQLMLIHSQENQPDPQVETSA